MEPLTLGAKFALVLGLFSLSFMLNIPCGFIRSKYRKFSLGWIVSVHATIPIIYFCRVLSNLDYKYIPVFITAAIVGQVWGGRLEF